jgi:hypothetical protein
MGGEAFVSRPDEAAHLRNSREWPLWSKADRFPRKRDWSPFFLELALPSLVESGNLDLSTVIIPRMSA